MFPRNAIKKAIKKVCNLRHSRVAGSSFRLNDDGPLLAESLLLLFVVISIAFRLTTMRWLAASASKYALLGSFGGCGASVSCRCWWCCCCCIISEWPKENVPGIDWNPCNNGIVWTCACCANELNTPDCRNSMAISRRRSFSNSLSRTSRSRCSRRSWRRRSELQLRERLRDRLRLWRRSRLRLRLSLLFFDLKNVFEWISIFVRVFRGMATPMTKLSNLLIKQCHANKRTMNIFGKWAKTNSIWRLDFSAPSKKKIEKKKQKTQHNAKMFATYFLRSLRSFDLDRDRERSLFFSLCLLMVNWNKLIRLQLDLQKNEFPKIRLSLWITTRLYAR